MVEIWHASISDAKAHSPSGDLVEHVIAEGQVPVFWQNLGLLCKYPHTQEWICLIAELRSFHDWT